jgi:hypothetical protein
LTKEEKKKIGNPSMPRPEIDVLAYSARRNELKIIECKSFLDSRGVKSAELRGEVKSGRYKLFNNRRLRSAVISRLKRQLIESGACREGVSTVLCLACGKVASEKDRNDLRVFFEEKRWQLFDDRWIAKKVREKSNFGYENEVSTVVAKLLRDGGSNGS